MPNDEYENNNIAELRERLKELERENLEIKGAISEIAQANVLPGILQNGFDNVIAELRPLRDLAPRRESVPQAIAEAVAAMLAAMEGVALSGGSLGIPEVNVPFIGQPRPQLVDGVVCQPGEVLLPRPVDQANPNQTLLPNQQLYSREIRP